MVRTRVDGLALAALLAAAACGSVERRAADGGAEVIDGGAPGQDGGDPIDAGIPSACQPGGDPSYDEAWDCARDAFCRLFARCLNPIELEDCRRFPVEMFGAPDAIQIERLREAIDQGTAVYHPDRVAACLTATDELECASFGQSTLQFIDLCPIFTGTVADGDTCYTSIECDTPGAVCGGPTVCEAGDVCCELTCVPPADLLGACADDVACSPGLFCVEGVCRSGDTGSACTNSSQCDQSYWCDTDTCQPDVGPGAPCVEDEQCPSPESCLGDDLEGGTGGTCGRTDGLGDACDTTCFGFPCLQVMPTVLGECVEPAGENESCAEVACHASFDCSDGDELCVPMGGLGAPCTGTSGQCRIGHFCDTEVNGVPEGECDLPRPAGASCIADRHCASGICNEIALMCEDFPGCFP